MMGTTAWKMRDSGKATWTHGLPGWLGTAAFFLVRASFRPCPGSQQTFQHSRLVPIFARLHFSMISLRPRGVDATTLRQTCLSSTSRPIAGHKPIRFQGFMVEHVPGCGSGREIEADDLIRPPAQRGKTMTTSVDLRQRLPRQMKPRST